MNHRIIVGFSLIWTLVLPVAHAHAIRCGDLTANGQVTSADVTLLQRVVNEEPDPFVCAGLGALACGDVAPINSPNGIIGSGDVNKLQQSINGVAGAPPPHYLVCTSGSCESNMDEPEWIPFFGTTLTPLPPPYTPPVPYCFTSGSTLLTTGAVDQPAVVYGAQGYAGSPRVQDMTFVVPSADLAKFGHIFVGSGESDEFGGRIGVALGDIGYNGSLTTLYIEFVRKSGTMPGCTVPADGLIAGGPGTQDDTWVFYPGNGGLVVPTIQPGRWYRIASIAGKRNDGGISVTASWTDIVSGDQRAISYDFPASCTPTWWDTNDQRPWFGVAPKVGFGNVNVLLADFFIRPPRP